MLKKPLAVFGLVAVLTLTTSAQDAKTVIGDASKVLGVDTLKTVQYSATGFDFALNQAPSSRVDRSQTESARERS